MQGKDHNLILGIAFLIEFIIYGLVVVLIFVMLLLQLILMLSNNPDAMAVAIVGGSYAVIMGVMLLIALPLGVASWKLLKNKNKARIWGVISAIISLPLMIPIGLIIGIYGLWFFFSEEGKRFYEGGDILINKPPLPPNSWQ